jgi:hypothetical protein
MSTSGWKTVVTARWSMTWWMSFTAAPSAFFPVGLKVGRQLFTVNSL